MGWALDMKNKNMSANKDKVAIVTGSATGIGYETAIHAGEKWLLYICINEKYSERK